VQPKVIVTGFKGFGYVGYNTVSYLIEELNAELIGVIDTIYFPQSISVRSGVAYSPYQIYQYGDMLLLLFEELGLDEEANYILKKVVEWSKYAGVERCILVGGLDKSIMKPGDEPVKIVFNRPWISRYGVVEPVLRENIRVIGPLAVMLHYTTVFEIPAMAILAFAEMHIEDMKAAANAVKKLNEVLNLNVSTEKLVVRAATMEKRIERLMTEYERRGEGLYA
jgi:uncharacterized protein